jgi:hypothetical protein
VQLGNEGFAEVADLRKALHLAINFRGRQQALRPFGKRYFLAIFLLTNISGVFKMPLESKGERRWCIDLAEN